MNRLYPSFNEMKLKLFSDQRIIIENFKELKDLNEGLIIVDQYFIYGTFLKISKMDPSKMEIYGTIKEIKIIQEK